MMTAEERRKSDQSVLALCPTELRIGYMMSLVIREQVVDLSATGVYDVAATTIIQNLDALVIELEINVAEIKRKTGVQG